MYFYRKHGILVVVMGSRQPKKTPQNMFRQKVTVLFEGLYERFSKLEGEGFDLDDADDALKLTTPDGGIYLIHPHSIMEQVWLSSPCSGAWHFSFDEHRGDWYDTRKGLLLTRLLEDELSAYGVVISE